MIDSGDRRERLHVEAERYATESNVDFDRDSKQILESVGLKTSSGDNPSVANYSDQTGGLSNVKSAQLQRLGLISQR